MFDFQSEILLKLCHGNGDHFQLILSSCSGYFDEILSSIAPNQHPVIFLKDIPFWILKSLCDFMYAGEVHIDQSKLEELLHVAEILRVSAPPRNRPPAHRPVLADQGPGAEAGPRRGPLALPAAAQGEAQAGEARPLADAPQAGEGAAEGAAAGEERAGHEVADREAVAGYYRARGSAAAAQAEERARGDAPAEDQGEDGAAEGAAEEGEEEEESGTG